MQRVSAREAHALIEGEGYVYLDVRSAPEFAEAHPAGATNVPWLEPTPHGMARNTAFLEQVRQTFRCDTRIVVGCASGVRSLEAAKLLEENGFLYIREQRAGMAGVRDPFGRIKEPGWRDEGLPMDTEG
jgi:rhodanese-related sulfurtransferase